jgi:hypothetical protein
MPYHTDVNGSRLIVYLINDPVIPDANAPKVGCAFQLGAPGWPRIPGE